MTATAFDAKQHEGYWVAFFALRMAQTIDQVKDKRARSMLREDVQEFLRSGVPSAHVAETIRKELRR